MKNVAHKKKWQSFEIVFGIPFFSAIILQFIYPLSFSFKQLYEIFIFGGVVLIILGLAFIILAHRELSKYSQPTDPGYPTNKLVTTGVFSISRNPLYLGGVCVVFGIGLSLNIGWILILLLPSLIACHYILVMPEEKYLTAMFGEEYHIYSNSVHRWVGRA